MLIPGLQKAQNFKVQLVVLFVSKYFYMKHNNMIFIFNILITFMRVQSSHDVVLDGSFFIADVPTQQYRFQFRKASI